MICEPQGGADGQRRVRLPGSSTTHLPTTPTPTHTHTHETSLSLTTPPPTKLGDLGMLMVVFAVENDR
ncbi:hypothetical protein HanRHA438_Chr17g0816641 [Helianthus annuus]|nr:hypothetical protein HanRHA438_Chr17g0816641 [Helianthus annuus]